MAKRSIDRNGIKDLVQGFLQRLTVPSESGEDWGEERRIRPGIYHMAIQGLAATANQPLNRLPEVRP